MSREKLMPLSKMLESQAETRLWALEMVPKGFRCDDKAYPSKKQKLHMTKQQQKPNEKHVTILNQYINGLGSIVQIGLIVVRYYLQQQGNFKLISVFTWLKIIFFSLLLLSQHEGELPQFPKHYNLHHNNSKQGLKAPQLQIKKEKQDGMKGKKDPQLSAASIKLRFW